MANGNTGRHGMWYPRRKIMSKLYGITLTKPFLVNRAVGEKLCV